MSDRSSLVSPARRRLAAGLAVAMTAGTLALAAATTASAAPPPDSPAVTDVPPGWHTDSSSLWVDPRGAIAEHIKEDGLAGQAKADAELLASYASATWFTKGTPNEVRREVKQKVVQAFADKSVPVLVAYNLPYRDCAQYSAGGALSVEDYKAWIDGFAAGIGNRPAIVILEPDGLGIIPWYTNADGALEWCQPADADPATAAADRFEMLNYAVDALAALPSTSVYLDGGHSAWNSARNNAARLIDGGVLRADGFYLNASNYQFTENSVFYGHWISNCIALIGKVGLAAAGCGDQYYNGGPASGWSASTMDRYAVWNTDPVVNGVLPDNSVVAIESRYAADLGDTVPTAHFVVDTSRNGLGPWNPKTAVHGDLFGPDPEDWCNPPDRGLGLRPTTATGDPLVDAYLWIKVPGESDGLCTRTSGLDYDPERGYALPAAGQWFPEQARELIELAVPAVE